MIKRIEGFDLDGCLIDSSHRYRRDPETGRIDLAHWIENCNPEMVAKDTLLPTAEYYKKCVADPEVYTVIATARVFNPEDYEFVKENLGMPDKLITRPAENHTSGATLKLRGMAFLTSLKQFRDLPGFFHEDNADYLVAICNTMDYNGFLYPSEQRY